MILDLRKSLSGLTVQVGPHTAKFMDVTRRHSKLRVYFALRTPLDAFVMRRLVMQFRASYIPADDEDTHIISWDVSGVASQEDAQDLRRHFGEKLKRFLSECEEIYTYSTAVRKEVNAHAE